MTVGLRITLAEYAATNADGTYTIVRGGIITWDTDLPAQVPICALVEIPADALENASHPIDGSLRAPSGGSLLGFGGTLDIVERTLPTRFAVPLVILVQEHGTFTLSFKVGPLSGETTLEVRPSTATAGK